jgi:hypothetical protein
MLLDLAAALMVRNLVLVPGRALFGLVNDVLVARDHLGLTAPSALLHSVVLRH